MSDLDVMGFGQNDEDVKNNSKRFKAKAGTRYRISFAYWPETDKGELDLNHPTPLFKKAHRLYSEKVGYFVDKGPDFQRLVGGEAGKIAIGTVIVVWPLDEQENVDKVKLQAGKFQVFPWVFGKDKYEDMGNKHRKRHLGKHDLEIDCSDEKFQKMKFDTYDGSILRQILENPKAEKVRDSLVKQIKAAVASLDNQIARDLSIEEVRAKLSGETTPFNNGRAVTVGETDEEIDSFLSEEA